MLTCGALEAGVSRQPLMVCGSIGAQDCLDIKSDKQSSWQARHMKMDRLDLLWMATKL